MRFYSDRVLRAGNEALINLQHSANTAWLQMAKVISSFFFTWSNKGVTDVIKMSREGTEEGRDWNRRWVTRRCDKRSDWEKMRHLALSLMWIRRWYIKKVTGQKGGYYPGKEQEKEEDEWKVGTIFSNGEKLHLWITHYSIYISFFPESLIQNTKLIISEKKMRFCFFPALN